MTEDEAAAIVDAAYKVDGDLSKYLPIVWAVAVARVQGDTWTAEIDLRDSLASDNRISAIERAEDALYKLLTTGDPTLEGWEWSDDYKYWHACIVDQG